VGDQGGFLVTQILIIDIQTGEAKFGIGKTAGNGRQISEVIAMQEEYPCREKCKYQREGRCILKGWEILSPIDGAVCMEHLLDDEENLYR